MLQRKTFAVASIAATIYLIQSTTCPVAKAASEHNNLQHVSFPAFRGKPSPAKDAVQKLISANYSCSVPLRDDFTELSFAVGDDGVIYDPEILHSSNNDQHDAECLEALCGLSPLKCLGNPSRRCAASEPYRIAGCHSSAPGHGAHTSRSADLYLSNVLKGQRFTLLFVLFLPEPKATLLSAIFQIESVLS